MLIAMLVTAMNTTRVIYAMNADLIAVKTVNDQKTVNLVFVKMDGLEITAMYVIEAQTRNTVMDAVPSSMKNVMYANVKINGPPMIAAPVLLTATITVKQMKIALLVYA